MEGALTAQVAGGNAHGISPTPSPLHADAAVLRVPEPLLLSGRSARRDAALASVLARHPGLSPQQVDAGPCILNGRIWQPMHACMQPSI